MKKSMSSFKKVFFVTSAAAILSTTLSPAVQASEAKKQVVHTQSNLDNFNDLKEMQKDPEFIKIKEYEYSQNPNFDSELFEGRQKANSIVFKETTPNATNDMVNKGVVGGTLKSIKALSPILKHGGTALSWLVKPLSKKHGVLIKKYSRKMASGIDKLDSATKSAVTNAFVKVGIPLSDAKTLTYIVFLLI